MYLFVTWPKSQSFKLTIWEVLTIGIISVLVNQLVGSYDAHVIVYIFDLVFLLSAIYWFSRQPNKHTSSSNQLTNSIRKIGKLNNKGFENFVIALLKKYSFQSISKFDVRDDSDKISDNYLLAQREGVFYEIRTFTSTTEINETQINKLVSKFRDSPTQADNKILFINTTATDHVSHLINNSGITLTTIDLQKIKDLIKVVEPQNLQNTTGLKLNIAHGIDFLTTALNSIKVKLVGVENNSLNSTLTVEQALNETIINEHNKLDSQSLEDSKIDTTVTESGASQPQPSPSNDKEANENTSKKSNTPIDDKTVDTNTPQENLDNEKSEREADLAKSETTESSSNIDTTDTKEVDTAEPDIAIFNEENEHPEAITEDELNNMEVVQDDEFSFDSTVSTVTSKIDLSVLDDFPTDNTNSDDDLFSKGNELLSPTSTVLADNQSNSEPDENSKTDNDIDLLTPKDTKSDSTSLVEEIQDGSTDIETVNDGSTSKIELLVQPTDADKELELMLAAQESSLQVDDCANFDEEGSSEHGEYSQDSNIDYTSLDLNNGSSEMTAEDILAMAILNDEVQFENEILISTKEDNSPSLVEDGSTDQENFSTESDTDLLSPKQPEVVKKKRTRGKNKTL